MRKPLLFLAVCACAVMPSHLAAQQKTLLHHFTPDVEGHRMFPTAGENGKVIIFDTETNKVLRTIGDLKAPHAILYRAERMSA